MLFSFEKNITYMRLNKFICSVILILFFETLNAQVINWSEGFIFPEPIEVTIEKTLKRNIFNQGDVCYLISMKQFQNPTTSSINLGFRLVNKNGDSLDFSNDDFQFLKLITEKNYSTEQIWNFYMAKEKVLESSFHNLMNYELRNEQEKEALDFENSLWDNNEIFKEDYFLDYCFSILNKIHFGVLNDGRSGTLTVKLMKSPTPNAFCFSNGTIIITTGLLSTIQSEAELVGILAHEVAHFVLDHQIMNILEKERIEKKALMWASIATAAAAAADAILVSKNSNLAGIATTGTTIISSFLVNQISQNFGLKYNFYQENIADEVSALILKSLGYNEKSEAIALKRIGNHMIITGDYKSLYNSTTHPPLNTRKFVNDLTNADLEASTDNEFLTKASLINSYNAELELFANNHYKKAEILVDNNIKNNVGTEIDYIMKGMIIRRLGFVENSLDYFIKAEKLDVTNEIIVYKELFLTHLRLGNFSEARLNLSLYLKELENLNIKNSVIIFEEINWVKKMKFKLENADSFKPK